MTWYDLNCVESTITPQPTNRIFILDTGIFAWSKHFSPEVES